VPIQIEFDVCLKKDLHERHSKAHTVA
jgi:hypothetical protein